MMGRCWPETSSTNCSCRWLGYGISHCFPADILLGGLLATGWSWDVKTPQVPATAAVTEDSPAMPASRRWTMDTTMPSAKGWRNHGFSCYGWPLPDCLFRQKKRERCLRLLKQCKETLKQRGLKASMYKSNMFQLTHHLLQIQCWEFNICLLEHEVFHRALLWHDTILVHWPNESKAEVSPENAGDYWSNLKRYSFHAHC